ncbi:MAG TPA: urease accessory protein UreE [Geminicoccaceae bacterium]
MRRLVRAARGGEWPEAEASGSLTLPFDHRSRRRMRMTTDQGEPILLDLAQPARLADGDGLADEAGGWLRVLAAEEDVLEVSGGDACHSARIAWHLGNRHLAVEVLPDGRLRLAYDHVIEHMLIGLGARCARRLAPFQPEAGAYAHHDHG